MIYERPTLDGLQCTIILQPLGEKEGFHLPLSFDFDFAPRFKGELVFLQIFNDSSCYLNTTWDTRRLHARSQIDAGIGDGRKGRK